VIVVEALIDESNKEGSNQPTLTFTLTEDSLESNPVSSSDSDNDAELGQLLSQNYHFAMSGRTWGFIRSHFHHLVPKLIQRGTIFARMAPEQKAQLVEEFQAIDYVSSDFLTLILVF